MATKKKIENSQRLRYIRVLERFFNSIVSYISKNKDLTKEDYIKRVQNNLKYLNRIENVALYKSEFTELESVVEKMKSLALGDENIDEISSIILNRANKLEQSNNNRKYKKDKHKNEQFKDWQ